MSHRYRRLDRVDELIKREIARLIGEAKDPRVGFATVMDVETTPDLRHARIFVSVLGDEAEKQATLAALDGARGWFRTRLGRVLTLKYLPDIRFELDRTLERAARISAILHEIHEDDEPDAGLEDAE